MLQSRWELSLDGYLQLLTINSLINHYVCQVLREVIQWTYEPHNYLREIKFESFTNNMAS